MSILIVDDEHIIRDILKGTLTETGVTMFEAEDGNGALDIFKEKKDDIDLIILDVIMPGMKGDEVLRRVREIKRKVKVIVSSGYMSEEQREKLKEYGVDGFLDKPFKDEDAMSIISKVLAN